MLRSGLVLGANAPARLMRHVLGAVVLLLACLALASQAFAQTVYVPNSGSNTVSVINAATNTVIATVTVGNTPRTVAVTPDGTRAYVTNSGSNTVSVIDTATNTVVATVAVGQVPYGATVNPFGTSAFVTNFNSGTVTEIDVATNAVVRTFFTGGNGNPRALAFHWSGGPLYVASGPNVAVHDPGLAYQAVGLIPLGSTADIAAPLTPGIGAFAYVANGVNTVDVIDTFTQNYTGTSILVGNSPSGVAVSPDTTRVYATNFGSNTVSVIDTGNNSVIATIAVGSGPRGVKVTPDGTRVYVANTTSNTVSVINTATNALIATVPVGPSPFYLAIGPAVAPAPPAAVPTLSEWAMILFGLLLAGGAALYIQRRQLID